MAGQGFAEAQVTWFGVVVPKGTPQQDVEQIGKALEAAWAKVVKEAHYRRLRPRRRDFGQVIRFRYRDSLPRRASFCPVRRCFQHVPRPEIHRILHPDRSPAQPT
jgi:hypothetical protein